MTKADEWKVLEDDSSETVTTNETQDDNIDTQASERKRRLLQSSKTKTHRRNIQDIVQFLTEEVKAADETIKWEHRTDSCNHVIKVTVMGDHVEAKKKTLKTAKVNNMK